MSLFEIQPWTAEMDLEVSYMRREGPSRFANFEHPFIAGSWNMDGNRIGYFRGRLAEIFIGLGVLPRDKVETLRASTTNPSELPLAAAVGPPSVESHKLFVDDLTSLRNWSKQSELDDHGSRAASVILYRWFFDRHPLIKRICEGYGIQLWLPGKSERRQRNSALMATHSPVFHQSGSYGSSAILGSRWVTLEQFRGEAAFHVKGVSVSHEAFVKFVRNKLGGGHFDEVDRARWQKDLVAMSQHLLIGGQRALNRQMHELIAGVIEAVEACGIEAQAR
ncbi:MAG: hypothetical protein M3P51_05710, partial [Chloroflexota bacterium]|nr:hypothetical protein [Chloroflexota bacterium]